MNVIEVSNTYKQKKRIIFLKGNHYTIAKKKPKFEKRIYEQIKLFEKLNL